MDKKTPILIVGCFLTVFILYFLFLFFDSDLTEKHHFVYNDTLISDGRFTLDLCVWIAFDVFCLIHMFIVPRFKELYFLGVVLFTVLLIDYPLTYNEPFSKYYLTDDLWFPIGVPLWVGLSLVCTFVYLIFKALKR